MVLNNKESVKVDKKGKLDYKCEIVTPDLKTAKEIRSDNPIEPQKGEVVYIEGGEYVVSQTHVEYDFDSFVRVCIVYLENIE